MGESKLRVRVGSVEIEFEGSETFIKAELPALIEKLAELNHSVQADNAKVDDGGNSIAKTTKAQGTTYDLAGRLSAKTGSQLALAAALQLTLRSNKTQFTKADLLKEMKSANGYYKATFSNNLNNYIKTLIGKKRLSEVATDTFTLTAACKKEMEKKLADG